MQTATKIKDLRKDDWQGNATLYQVSPPVCFSGSQSHFVVVSAVHVLGTPETYIFPSDCDGQIINWLELPGSYKGGLDHSEALRDAGYEVIP